MNVPTVKEEPCPMCGERDRRLCDCHVIYDWRGSQICIGSTIVYAVTQSSNVTMKEGIVERIESVKDRWREQYNPVLYVKSGGAHNYGANEPGKVVKITAVQRVTVVYPHVQPLLNAAENAIWYHRRRSDTEYPGYIWVEWDDLTKATPCI